MRNMIRNIQKENVSKFNHDISYATLLPLAKEGWDGFKAFEFKPKFATIIHKNTTQPNPAHAQQRSKMLTPPYAPV